MNVRLQAMPSTRLKAHQIAKLAAQKRWAFFRNSRALEMAELSK
jgi:hypothetical protein